MNAAQFDAQLADLIQRLGRGEAFPWAAAMPLLSQSDRERRTRANLALAEALLQRMAEGDPELAEEMGQRAWNISGFSDEAFPLRLVMCKLRGDAQGVADAYKRVGMRQWEAARYDKAFELFQRAQHAYIELHGIDRVVFDYELQSFLDHAAEARPLPPASRPAAAGGKVRLGYLLFGITHLNSIIVRTALGIMPRHDPERFEVTCYIPERLSTLLIQPHARQTLETLAGLPLQVVTAPDAADEREALWQLAARIRADGTDLLIDFAALGDYRRYYLTRLRPTPLLAGYLLGPPSQYVPAHLDFVIAGTAPMQMDVPADCDLVPGAYSLPDFSRVAPLTRAELGLPDDAFVLAASGRPVKFSDAGYWRGVGEILAGLPGAHFIAIGVAADQVDLGELPASVAHRIHCTGWRSDNLAIVALADVVMDTYPTGGGYALAEPMALGIPAMAFHNDYSRAFDPVHWSPIEETLAIPDILFRRGDFTAMAAQARRLAADPAYRRALGEQCRGRVLAMSDPERMVRQLEAVILRRLGREADPDLASAPAAPRSNLAYWQQIQADGYFEQHPCYRGLRDFDRDEQIVQFYTPLRPGMKVVEIGCGYGRDVARFAPLVGHVWGIDVSAAILDKARRYTAEQGVTNFTPVLAERWKDDIPDGIDLVWSIVVFQHLTRDLVRDYLAGLAAKLAPGGMFLCQFAEPAQGEADARLAKYEPSVKWTRPQITALVAELGLELFVLDDYRLNDDYVWHWAWFGRRDAWPRGRADLSAAAVWAKAMGEPTPAQRNPARLPLAAVAPGAPRLTGFDLRATGATGYDAQLSYQRGGGLQGSVNLHYAPQDSLLAPLNLADPHKGFALEVTPGGIVACWAHGHDFETAWTDLLASGRAPSIAFTFLDDVLGGGGIILFRYVDWLSRLGVAVAVYSNAPRPAWLTLDVAFHSIPEERARYAAIAEDVILVYSALELPHLLAAVAPGRAILHFCQSLEHLHYPQLRGMRSFQDYFHLLHSLPVGRLTVSFHLHQHFLKQHGQISFLVPNGIDLGRFRPRPGHRPDPADLRFLLVGNPWDERKNAAGALAALTELACLRPDWRITLEIALGDPNAQPLPVPADSPVRVQMHRGLNAGQMRELYGRADALLAVSLYEGFGLPSIEAMACGVPVLQSDSQGLDGYLRDGVDCLMVPGEAAGRQAEALERLLTEPSLYERLVAGGLETAQRFSLGQQFDAFVREFQTLLGQGFDAERTAAIRAGLDQPGAAAAGAAWPEPLVCAPGRAPAVPEMPAGPQATSTGPKEMGEPFFSILVPTYNHAHFLPAALDSLIAQTWPHWEAVVVNDGSTDGTHQVLADYAARDPRIRVFHQANGGTAAALNEALRHVRGGWVCWLSSDDLFQPDKLAIHVEAMGQAPDCACFFSNFYLLHEPGGRITPSGIDVAATIPPPGEEVVRLFRYNYFNGISVAIRREVFAAVGAFRAEFRNGQDFDMWLRIGARYRWMYIDHPTCITRQHEGQGTQRSLMTGIYDSTRACLDFLNQHPFADLFPGVDLADPDQATAALRLALEVLLDAGGYVNVGGLAVPFAERVAEWLAAHPVAEFRQALRHLVEAERFAGIDFPPELMAVWRRFAEADGPLPYQARNLLAPLTERVRALAMAGETERAAELAAYLAAARSRLVQA